MNLFPKIILKLVKLMNNNPKIPLMKNHRGVSNIIGSLIVLAVVASVGSVILFQGLNQINAFSHDLTLFGTERVNEIREDMIFEHVRFNPDDNVLELYIANIGSVDFTVATVTVVKVDTQELIIDREYVNETILIEENEMITLTTANLPLATPLPDVWDSPEYGPLLPISKDPVYKINVSTSKGNVFSTFASPFNT